MVALTMPPTIGAAIRRMISEPVPLANPDFKPKTLPVTADYLRSQGLGETFIQYMAGWEGFVASS